MSRQTRLLVVDASDGARYLAFNVGLLLMSTSAVDTAPDPLAIWEEFGRIFGRQHNFFDACGTIMERGMELAYDVEDAEEAGKTLNLSGP